MGRIEESGAWPARVCWVALALVAGGPFSDALNDHSTAVRLVAAAGLWIGWTAGLVALLVPRSTSLTALRVLLPTALVATVWAASIDGAGAASLVAVGLAALATATGLVPWVAEIYVNGSAYGPERRTPLRAPIVFSAVIAPLTVAVIVAGICIGPLLLGARQWLVGAVATAVGWPTAAAAARALHQLARRWVVLVPVGLVVHDPLSMPEPQLFLKETIARLGPASATDGSEGSDRSVGGPVTEDLTAGASGLVLELVATEPVELLVRRGRRTTETLAVERVLFTPSRPASVLAGAAERRMRVG